MVELRRKRLRDHLDDKIWSEGELARRSGVPLSTISRLLSGKRTGITLDTLDKLCEALGISRDDVEV